jgi:large subunit ribosomal protein L10
MSTAERNRAAKVSQVDMVREKFSQSVAAVLVDFRGIDVESVTELRALFREKGVEYRVVKNTLVRRALKDTPLEGNEALLEQLKGPTAIAWSFEDPSAAAKIIKTFRKDHEALTVKCGVLEGEILDGARVENELAALPSKDELRSMLLAQLLAPMQCVSSRRRGRTSCMRSTPSSVRASDHTNRTSTRNQ